MSVCPLGPYWPHEGSGHDASPWQGGSFCICSCLYLFSLLFQTWETLRVFDLTGFEGKAAPKSVVFVWFSSLFSIGKTPSTELDGGKTVRQELNVSQATPVWFVQNKTWHCSIEKVCGKKHCLDLSTVSHNYFNISLLEVPHSSTFAYSVWKSTGLLFFVVSTRGNSYVLGQLRHSKNTFDSNTTKRLPHSKLEYLYLAFLGSVPKLLKMDFITAAQLMKDNTLHCPTCCFERWLGEWINGKMESQFIVKNHAVLTVASVVLKLDYIHFSIKCVCQLQQTVVKHNDIVFHSGIG